MQIYDDNSFIALIFSSVLHLLLAYLFFFGLPTKFYKTPEQQVISFEMLPVQDISNVPSKKQTPVSDNKEEGKKIAGSEVSEVSKEQPKEEVPKEKPKLPDPESSKPAVEKPEIPKEILPEKVIREEKPKAVDKPEEIIPEKKILEEKIPEKKLSEQKNEEIKPKPKNKKKPPAPVDLDSLLKNLEKSSASNKAKADKQVTAEKSNDKENSSGTFDEELPLSVTESNIIQDQINKNWRPPLGGQNAYQIRVTYTIDFNPDGSVQKVVLASKDCASTAANLCSAFIQSAERAIWQASPITNLRPERYNVWKSLNFTFDPSTLLR